MATSVMSSISARNQINGRVAEIQSGPAMTVVTVSADGHTIVSAITSHAAKELGLKQHDSVVALVKSTDAIIAKGDAGAMRISARNKVSGKVTDIQKGSAMASVVIDAGQWKLTSAVTRHAVDELQLTQGDQVTVLFKSTEVMLQKAA
jgi:molybdate transport system regulatory protein